MIYGKVSPVGIDVEIQKIQTQLHNRLLTLWECEIEAYGRVYEDSLDKSVKPRVYIGNGEYKELLTDDSIKGVHFFFVQKSETQLASNSVSTNVDLDIIFIVNNINKVKPTISHYGDEEIKEDIRSILNRYMNIESFTKGEKALDGFDSDKIHFVYPYFMLKISGNLKYESSKCKL